MGFVGSAAKAAVPKLINLLHHPDYSVREAAISALGKIDGATAVLYFVNGLKDDHALVRQASARELGELGSKAKNSLPVLRMLLEDNDDGVQEAAEKAIEKIERNGHPK